MTTNYPGALDTTTQLKNDAVDATVSSNTHTGAHNNLADALIAIETELGAAPSGSFSDVVARLGNIIIKAPGSSQTIQSGADVQQLGLRRVAGQTADLLQIKDSSDVLLADWDKDGVLDVNSMAVSGTALASTHLSDTANILKNPSPAITTPSISSPTLTGTPTAPTPSVDDDSTKIATTAYVVGQGYARPTSPSFTGDPKAPTAAQGTNTTQVATTAFVVAEIIANQESGVPSGAITPYGAATAPANWLLCDGSAVSRTTYASLYAVIGTTFGSGDGSTTFNLPDLRGRSPVGKGTHVDVDAVGENEGGAEPNRHPKHSSSYSFGSTDDPGAFHNHSMNVDATGGHTHSVTGAQGGSGVSGGGSTGFNGTQSYGTGSAGSHSHSGNSASSEVHSHSVTGSVGVSDMTDTSGYLVTTYIIKI